MPQKYSRYRPPLQQTLRASRKPTHWRLAFFIALGVVVLLIPVLWIKQTKKEPLGNVIQSSEPVFDKTQYSLDDPTSPWVVVNKKRPLQPKTYLPAELRSPSVKLAGGKNSESMQLNNETAQALEALVTAAQAQGLQFMLVSGYRSHNTQKTIYDSEVKGFGQAVADQESARPGHSEHQTGWAADLGRPDGKCEIEACFADTPEGVWLAANAHKYGFIIRYAQDKTNITGYVYEPWHLRYVGIELAEEMRRMSIETLEEFFDLPPAPSY